MGQDDVNTVMKNHFTDADGNSTFDFGKYADRVKLGKELIDIIYVRENKEKISE